MLIDGAGTSINVQEGLKWLQKAADLNQPFAMNSLGTYYANGQYVETDLKKAFEYYKKSADLKDGKGMYLLSLCYFNGDGVQENGQEGLRLLTEAAKLGDKDALYALGFCYFYGEHGLPENKNLGMYYIEQSANGGNEDAISFLNRHKYQ